MTFLLLRRTFSSLRSFAFVALLFTIATQLMPTAASAQTKLYTSKSGSVKFFSAASLADIEGVSKSFATVLKPSTKQMLVKIPIQSFMFENGLMQEHFNENYMESDKYPDAVFKGTYVEDVDISKPGTYAVTVNGDLNIHNVTQKRTLKGTVKNMDGKLVLDCVFPVKLADHKISIPSAVTGKIAEEVKVTLHTELTEK